MRVLAVASEAYPLVKTGGLADVVSALPPALAAEGVEVRTLLPGYPAVLAGLADGEEVVLAWADLFGGPARLLRGQAGGLGLFVLDAPHLYDRPGQPYTAPDGRDWPDNAQRFAALGRAGADIARGAIADWQPDILHAHDWQAGLAPAFLQYGGPRRCATVITVHNLAFQGQFPANLLGPLGLPPEAWSMEGVEYYGSIGFLKAGLALADHITTVSPSYAAEICTMAGGMGLDGLLRHRADRLLGILNGIDTEVWNPATDNMLATPFDAAHPGGRRANKAAIQQHFGLDADPRALLYVVVSRLTWQKGFDLLIDALPELLGTGAQLAVLGTGERSIQEALREAAGLHPGRIGCVIGYDEALAHLMQGGADALLVPSRFEPCGLTQLCALRYGTLPVVARTGGLADTVIDANDAAIAAGTGTGVQFAPDSVAALEAAFRRTATLWRDPAGWRRLQRNAMRADVSWRRPAAQYAALFASLLPKAAPRPRIDQPA